MSNEDPYFEDLYSDFQDALEDLSAKKRPFGLIPSREILPLLEQLGEMMAAVRRESRETLREVSQVFDSTMQVFRKTNDIVDSTSAALREREESPPSHP